MRPFVRAGRVLAAAFLLAALANGAPALAQEEDDSEIVPDSLFTEQPSAPVRYGSSYNHDQVRGSWEQTLDYNRSWRRIAMNLSGSSGTSEDVARTGSRSTTGSMNGQINWRAVSRLVLSMSGRFSMSSIADGVRSSTSEQRRNALSLQGQYRIPIRANGSLTVIGSSEFQRSFDFRASRRVAKGDTVGITDSISVQRDSSFASGRLDGARAQLRLPIVKGLSFDGTASGSRIQPTTTVNRFRASDPVDGSRGIDSITVREVQVPADNSSFQGVLKFERIQGTVATLTSRRTGIDQVYFDLGQLTVEQFSSDGRYYNMKVESALGPGIALTANGTLNRSLREYVARPNLNSLLTTRQGTVGVSYNRPTRTAFVSFDVNRTRAERQATSNGVTISRAVTTNLMQRVLGRVWLVGLGSATLNSYKYDFPQSERPARSFSKDDRDVASAFGSVGARFSVTPRCSTAANFSVSRTHNVSIDESRSNGNQSTTIYQLNGALRFPLSANLAIGQDYILTATYREFDFAEEKNDLSRTFRIDTSMADTLFPFAFIRLDHHYYFFDRGDFTPIVPGGLRFYGVAQEQRQQTLEGTVGVRPTPGITLVVKQSLSDTQNHDLFSFTNQGTEQWNLSLGLEVNRSFWDGAGITGAIRREDRYQTQSGKTGPLFKEDHWLASINFQKDF